MRRRGFLIETIGGLTIHPMQYLLLTLPLSIFYVLLVALAEHIGFFASYALASSSVIGLIAVYFSGIGANKKQTSLLVIILSTLYGLTLTMLTSEDYALLIGAISLFVCLSTFMLLTRKLNWSKGMTPITKEALS
jgi:inner membrane protein